MNTMFDLLEGLADRLTKQGDPRGFAMKAGYARGTGGVDVPYLIEALAASPAIEERAREIERQVDEMLHRHALDVCAGKASSLRNDIIALSLPTTEIRREALEEAAKVADRCAREYSVVFCDNPAAAVRDEIRALAANEPSPPSRPSFDKWDYAREVLDAAGCVK